MGCGPEDPNITQIQAALSADARRARAARIRDVSAATGLAAGALLAGIADAETNLAHCWSEATWACEGPDSPSCGGPVIAGAADGACELRQGGLGLFQFDRGVHDDTVGAYGDRVLQLDGNIEVAVEFVLAMVMRSTFVEALEGPVEDPQAAARFIESVPLDVEDPRYIAWIDTVTRYYNGCRPEASCWPARRQRYDERTLDIVAEMGSEFWAPASVQMPQPMTPSMKESPELSPGACVCAGQPARGGGFGGLLWLLGCLGLIQICARDRLRGARLVTKRAQRGKRRGVQPNLLGKIDQRLQERG